jgi:soluble lytic murein transglycosylase-like protein
MKQTLVLEGPAASGEEAVDSFSRAAETWRGMSQRARRAMFAATVGSSLAVLLSPALLSKQGNPTKVRTDEPGLMRAHETAPVKEEPAALEPRATKFAEVRGKLFAAVTSCRPSLSEGQRWRIVDAVHQEARSHGYDPLFVMAMVEVESSCSPTANSPHGAVGLTQIMPSTARAIAKDLGVPWEGRSTLLQPRLNVRLGLGYLAQLEEKFGDPYLAMAAYNLGPGKVTGMSRVHAKHAEYVKKILARYEGLLVEHAA